MAVAQMAGLDPRISAAMALVGLVGSIGEDSPEEKLRKYYAKMRKKQEKALDEYERASKAKVESSTRSNIDANRVATERILKQNGQLDSSMGLESLQKASNNAVNLGNKAISDVDLEIARRKMALAGQNHFVPEDDGYEDLFKGGLDLLKSNYMRGR